MDRAHLLLALAALGPGCSPELGDAPFSCGADQACPEGYSCRSTVCVRDGADVGPARPERVTWINAGEMFWLERPEGGAALVVNDGFTAGARGIYEIAVMPDGSASAPRRLLGYGDGSPVASSVVALEDGRYGIATLRFPDVDGDDMRLEVVAVRRDAGGAAGVETLYEEAEPYLGGSEPPYLGAVAGQGGIDIAWTRPSEGGRVEVLRIERQGSVWTRTRAASQPLPAEILPLSGDCALWRSGEAGLAVRVGFESFAVARVGADGALSAFAPADGVPLFALGDDLLVLEHGDYSPATSSYAVRYKLVGPGGEVLGDDAGGALQEGTEPYTATPFQDGALIAPLSDDPSFPAIEIGFRSAAQGLSRVASVARTSADDLYSARAFASGGTAYVAWTEFHESSMDLWVGAAPMTLATGARGEAAGRAPAPPRGRRVMSWGAGSLAGPRRRP
ncbi:MAG: hypothetical protein IT372_00505 [Polyangiaceae bacterium]|nr:hypothetical protein [Polyangiaceae bacterium]